MENFSTARVALLPRAANLATLAVVVAATWWSGAQRPLPQDGPLLGEAAKPAPRQPAEQNVTGPVAHWPVQTTSLPRDGLQPVGYQPRTTR